MPKSRSVRDYIRTIVDFPHEGIMFRDVTTLFADARGFRMAIDQMLHPYAGTEIDKVVGLEARGFILGGAIAHQLSVGFVPIRKKGKLPGRTISQDYKLEYGEAIVEIHDDAIAPGEKILLVDDLLATGGTAAAGIRLVERLGGEIVRPRWPPGARGHGHGRSRALRIRRGVMERPARQARHAAAPAIGVHPRPRSPAATVGPCHPTRRVTDPSGPHHATRHRARAQARGHRNKAVTPWATPGMPIRPAIAPTCALRAAGTRPYRR